METDAGFEAPTWNQTYGLLLSQAEKIRQSGFEPDVIVGVLRGGWFSAQVLSDLLEIPALVTITVKFYVDIAETKNEPVLAQGVSAAVAGKKALIVDDVADTGKSLKLAKDHVLQEGAKEVRTATVYRKPWSTIKPDYYEKETSRWIVFPWETKETVRKIVEKHRDKKAVNVEIAKLVKAGMPKPLVERFLREMLEERDC